MHALLLALPTPTPLHPTSISITSSSRFLHPPCTSWQWRTPPKTSALLRRSLLRTTTYKLSRASPFLNTGKSPCSFSFVCLSVASSLYFSFPFFIPFHRSIPHIFTCRISDIYSKWFDIPKQKLHSYYFNA